MVYISPDAQRQVELRCYRLARDAYLDVVRKPPGEGYVTGGRHGAAEELGKLNRVNAHVAGGTHNGHLSPSALKASMEARIRRVELAEKHAI